MSIKYPTIGCVTSIDKLEFLYQATENLRLEYNEKGKDYRKGKLSEDAWKDYREKVFKPKSKQLGYEVGLLREQLGYSTLDMEDEKNEPEVTRIIQEKQLFTVSERYLVDLNNLI